MNIDTASFQALTDQVADLTGQLEQVKRHMAAEGELVPLLLARLEAAADHIWNLGSVTDSTPGRPAARHAGTSGRAGGHLRSIAGGQT